MSEYNKFPNEAIESLYSQHEFEHTRRKIVRTLEFGYKRAEAIRFAGQRDALMHQLTTRETIVFSQSRKK